MMFEACAAVLAARAKRGAAAKNEPFVIADYGTADGMFKHMQNKNDFPHKAAHDLIYCTHGPKFLSETQCA